MPGDIIPTTPTGWPFLAQDNYLDMTPAYTRQLARKLQNSDADVAAAINAATRAEAAAASAAASTARFALSTSTTSSLAAGATVTWPRTFPAGRFTAAPYVFLQVDGSAQGLGGVSLQVVNRTKDGCSIVARNTGTLAPGFTVLLLAIQLP